jgi:hypothetical protein
MALQGDGFGPSRPHQKLTFAHSAGPPYRGLVSRTRGHRAHKKAPAKPGLCPVARWHYLPLPILLGLVALLAPPAELPLLPVAAPVVPTYPPVVPIAPPV